VTALIDLVPTWREDPVQGIRDTFKSDPFGNPLILDPCQIEIVEAVRDHDRVAVQSGRGVGKTATAGLLTHWWLSTRNPGLVVASAGSWAHLADKLWPEIGAWGRQWWLRDAFEYQVMGIYSNSSPEIWRAVAASSDKAVNVEGFHNPNLLLIIDEAKGMPDEIFAALVASLSGTEKAGAQKVVALSTPPTADVGWFAKACSNPRWHTIHVSGLDSPRVSKEYIEDIAETFGENSAEYKAYILGVIPEGITGQLIRKSWVEAAQALGENKDDKRPAVITCDVARMGDDLCVIGKIEHGKYNLVQFEDRWGWFAETDLMQVVKRITLAVKHHHAAAVCIDDTGLGGGVTDRLRELQSEGGFPARCTIWPVNFGAAPRRPDRFRIRKDEIWWSAREAIRIGEKQPKPKLALPTKAEMREWRMPRGSDLMTQLISPIWESNMKEQVQVYDKRLTGKEKTKSLPLKSPDLAHAFILGVDYYQRQEAALEPPKPPTNQEEALQRMMQDALKSAQQGRSRNPYRR